MVRSLNLNLYVTGASSSPESIFWSRNATLLLIQGVGEKLHLVESGKMKVNQMFQMITETLQAELGLQCSEQQVNNKWKSIKRSYKDIQDHNKNTQITMYAFILWNL